MAATAPYPVGLFLLSVLFYVILQPKGLAIAQAFNWHVSLASARKIRFTTCSQSPLNVSPSSHQSRLSCRTVLRATSRAKSNASRQRRRKSKGHRPGHGGGEREDSNQIETWRVYGVDVDPDSLGMTSFAARRTNSGTALPSERLYLTPPVMKSLFHRLRIQSEMLDDAKIDFGRNASVPIQAMDLLPHLKDARVVRRSIDARRRRRGGGPSYTYVIDVDVTSAQARKMKLIHQPGRMELLGDKHLNHLTISKSEGPSSETSNKTSNAPSDGPSNDASSSKKPKIIIVGAGPAGLFCALSLASSGLFSPIVLERGQPVEARGKSIGALIHRRSIDSESNFSFGEGGAGTWSDGKLTTRIGRNSGPVRFVLETLVKYGAPEHILVEGAPHLGTDNLVRLLRNMREDLRAMGGEIHFGSRVSQFHIDSGMIRGVDVECGQQNKSAKSKNLLRDSVSRETILGDAVVLATGHSARDVYEELHNSGVPLEAKGFAVGFRIEHPQRIINEIQYGADWGSRVITRRMSTDVVNKKHFLKYDNDDCVQHTGRLPVASYRLATNEAFDGKSNRGAYSFCMCPGGQIVPSSTEEGELCINGMSFSNRDSLWANSALVVTVSPDDPILEEYRQSHGCLAGLEFQREIERVAANLGGGNMTAPAQRVTDYITGKISASLPPSSYRLGVKSAACHKIYPKPLYNALVDAITRHFEKQMPGFVCDDALLHGVETRTSSPVRIPRDPNTCQSNIVENLFPAGEGAGFAGGIVSAAVDGLVIADAIKSKFSSKNDGVMQRKKTSTCFEY